MKLLCLPVLLLFVLLALTPRQEKRFGRLVICSSDTFHKEWLKYILRVHFQMDKK